MSLKKLLSEYVLKCCVDQVRLVIILWISYLLAQMTSVEHVMEYGVLEPEESSSDVNYKEPPKDWPSKGEIKMENVCFKYESDQPNVLSDLCITASGSEKVGIVGRTGAGKSSLISVLYRLAEPEGHVVIDGISTKSIKLNDLRQKISIIPQDPLLLVEQ